MCRRLALDVSVLALFALLLALSPALRAQSVHATPDDPTRTGVVFPSDNEALLEEAPERFYMGLERNFGRYRAFTWEGGTYGYVRNARQTPAGWRYTRYHEGVDIAPTRRDERGEPLDLVRSVDEGRVVYVNSNPRGSDYGRYIVVEHWWTGSPYYTLYAHLAETTVREGQQLQRGAPIGVMGYSGTGLDRDRAHVHFEVNLLLNEHFGAWRAARNPRWGSNHGRFHGLNLAGIAPAEFLTQARFGVGFSIRDWVTSQYEDVTAFVPAGSAPDILTRYPWLCRACDGAIPEWAPSWEVGFTRGGLPVRIEPSDRRVATLELGRVDPFVEADYLESRMLSRRGSGASLSSSGRSLISLLFARPELVPTW